MIWTLSRHVRRMLVFVPAAALLALPATATAAVARPLPAAGSTSLTCTLTITVAVHPGLTTQLRHVNVSSHGLTGIADCTGTASGQAVTGPGVWGEAGHGVVNCAGGSGRANFVLRLPTASGTRTVSGKYMFSFSGLGAPIVITGDLTGTATVVGASGDCFTTPLTRATLMFAVHSTT